MVYVTVPAVVPNVEIVWTGIVEVPLVVYPVTPEVADALHAKVVPETLDVRVISEVGEPEHID
jgi:hypothetical protein